ncbi:hypothetical protein AXF42_Ash019184 [Apostasia shenzhenica]|uniref:Uncharacterized protein n=1 Tax=Apostasia shenzhenica TaxID=1088818 RepID=A0A2I0B2G4_9ASPA|nr:hypothetical protein AXF42_Ash019184 [Apostasia shenzhenica]
MLINLRISAVVVHSPYSYLLYPLFRRNYSAIVDSGGNGSFAVVNGSRARLRQASATRSQYTRSRKFCNLAFTMTAKLFLSSYSPRMGLRKSPASAKIPRKVRILSIDAPVDGLLRRQPSLTHLGINANRRRVWRIRCGESLISLMSPRFLNWIRRRPRCYALHPWFPRTASSILRRKALWLLSRMAPSSPEAGRGVAAGDFPAVRRADCFGDFW